MVGGGGVARLDISSGLPRCSRPLIENILVYLGMRIWGERVEERTGGSKACAKVPLQWLRSLSSGSRGSSWEWLGGAETWVSAPAQLLHPTSGKSLALAGPPYPHLIVQVGTRRPRDGQGLPRHVPSQSGRAKLEPRPPRSQDTSHSHC